jgi:hypothetical protein
MVIQPGAKPRSFRVLNHAPAPYPIATQKRLRK